MFGISHVEAGVVLAAVRREPGQGRLPATWSASRFRVDTSSTLPSSAHNTVNPQAPRSADSRCGY